MLNELFTYFCDFINLHGTERTYTVGYSGGVDSQVLLALCVRLRNNLPFKFNAIHINHALHPCAVAWQEHCRKICCAWDIALSCYVIDARPPRGESLENYARTLRYNKFAELLAEHEMLLTAHHQNDQAETLLLQLMRGAGVKGLSAMPAVRGLGLGYHGRPLLNISRALIQQYAVAEGLAWIEDDSNDNLQHRRNYLRHKIMPALSLLWPRASAMIARSAQHCAQAQECLEAIARENLALIVLDRHKLSVQQLLTFSPAIQKLLIRSWLGQQQIRLPSEAKLQQILTTVLSAGADKQPRVVWGDVQFWRYQNAIYLLPAVFPKITTALYVWDCQQPLCIADYGVLTAIASAQQGLDVAWVNMITVRFRQAGEVYSLPSGEHHSLKKLFQALKVLPWLRGLIPLIYVADELAAVPGYLVVEKFKAKPGAASYHFNFSFSRYLGQNDLYYPGIV